MAKTVKTIKAFIPFAVNSAFHAWCRKAVKAPDAAREAVAHFVGKDPAAHEWSHMGLTNVMPNEDALVHDLDGAGYMLMYQIAERKLPASVRDDELKARYDALVEKEGRALNKKEFAQLREDVESSLLPKAFVIRSQIPVIVTPKRLLVCTSSASKCEKILAHLMRMCETRKVALDWSDVARGNSPSVMLTQLVRDGQAVAEDDDAAILYPGKAAVFKGDKKNTVRVKDRDLSHEEFKAIVNEGEYEVTELAISLWAGDQIVSTFNLTDKFIFKAVKLTDVAVAGTGVDTNDLHASFWLYTTESLRILDAVTAVYMDGQDDAKPDADDEL